MSTSIYRLSVGTFAPMLGRMQVFLDRAEAYSMERGFSPDVLMEARLAPDMYPLSQQIRYASDIAKGASARLIGARAPAFSDEDRTLAELRRRLDRTISYLQTLTEAQMQDAEERPITVQVNGAPATKSGRDYLLEIAAPNFHFHVTTAYAILRSNGVPLGKRDYLGI